jgi:hypothetical protein
LLPTRHSGDRIIFDPGFAGPKTIYEQSLDVRGDATTNSLGTWIVPFRSSPSVSLASLPSGAGLTQTLAFTASTRNGGPDQRDQTIINSHLDRCGKLLRCVRPTTNTLRLADDAGTSWSSPAGRRRRLDNSQCAVHGAGGSVSGSAGTLTLMIPITFDSGFAGLKTIYGLALDATGSSSNWQSLGSWNIPNVIRR